MMYTINRIDRYPSVVNYPGATQKVREINKDERNRRQQEQKKEESFVDIFEKSKKEEKPTYESS